MALVKCPECGKEISDQAKSCPNCGFVFEHEVLSKTRETELSEKKVNAAAGIALIVIGILVTILGGFTMGLIVGIVFVIVGLGMIGAGSAQLSGMQKGVCPYCDHEVSVKAKAETFKCPHCKKISTKKENSLFTID